MYNFLLFILGCIKRVLQPIWKLYDNFKKHFLVFFLNQTISKDVQDPVVSYCDLRGLKQKQREGCHVFFLFMSDSFITF